MIHLTMQPGGLTRRLSKDASGATIIEFAMVFPVLVLLIMGLMDMAHTQYSNSVLHGAMQKAGRDLTLESAGSRNASIDKLVRDQIGLVVPQGSTITFEKLSHFDFADVGEPEDILGDDLPGQPGHGQCEGAKGEMYIDQNNNNKFDKNRGKDGIGGARDVVLYTAVVSYPRLFPMYELAGLPKNVTIQASTVLRNQPFDEQDDRSNTQRPCP